jgi:pre-rRNA-processing protein TSR1
MEKHNPGVLKQKNKTHKVGRHRSKGEIERQSKGKVDVKTISRKSKNPLTKVENKNRLNQIRKQKRHDILNKKRCIGTLKGVPHIVVIGFPYRRKRLRVIIQSIIQIQGGHTTVA